jgi:rubrerythrin
MNTLEKALKKELEMKSFYEQLAAETPLPGVKRIFTLLAGDEQKHYDAVLAIQRKVAPGHVPDTIALETAKELLSAWTGDTETATHLQKDLDRYQLALKLETESVKFYEGLAKETADAREKKLLTTILKEENKHYTIVANLYDFALKPEYYLVWGEFSNLNDL